MDFCCLLQGMQTSPVNDDSILKKLDSNSTESSLETVPMANLTDSSSSPTHTSENSKSNQTWQLRQACQARTPSQRLAQLTVADQIQPENAVANSHMDFPSADRISQDLQPSNRVTLSEAPISSRNTVADTPLIHSETNAIDKTYDLSVSENGFHQPTDEPRGTVLPNLFVTAADNVENILAGNGVDNFSTRFDEGAEPQPADSTKQLETLNEADIQHDALVEAADESHNLKINLNINLKTDLKSQLDSSFAKRSLLFQKAANPVDSRSVSDSVISSQNSIALRSTSRAIQEDQNLVEGFPSPSNHFEPGSHNSLLTESAFANFLRRHDSMRSRLQTDWEGESAAQFSDSPVADSPVSDSLLSEEVSEFVLDLSSSHIEQSISHPTANPSGSVSKIFEFLHTELTLVQTMDTNDYQVKAHLENWGDIQLRITRNDQGELKITLQIHAELIKEFPASKIHDLQERLQHENLNVTHVEIDQHDGSTADRNHRNQNEAEMSPHSGPPQTNPTPTVPPPTESLQTESLQTALESAVNYRA